MIIIPGEDNISLHVVESGPKDGPAVVFAHALGSDLTMWDAVIAFLPDGLHV